MNAEFKKDVRKDINIKNTKDYFNKLRKKVISPVAEINNDILEMYKRTFDNKSFLQFNNKDTDN